MADQRNAPDFPSTVSFEWDENKRLSNIGKHGLDFFDCLEVFGDRNAYVYPSTRSGIEERFVTVGHVADKMVSVIFTQRGPLIRLISARIARRNERRRYEAEHKKRG